MSTQSKKLNWYVGYTRPRCEKKLSQCLERTRIECFLPTVKEKRQWTNRIKILEVPLFPNYIFIRTDEFTRWKVLNEYRELVNYVSFDGKPALMKNEEIEGIREAIQTNMKITTSNFEYYSDGTQVIIEKGMFSGLSGVIVKSQDNNTQKMIIQMNQLNQNIELCLDSPAALEQFQIRVLNKNAS